MASNWLRTSSNLTDQSRKPSSMCKPETTTSSGPKLATADTKLPMHDMRELLTSWENMKRDEEGATLPFHFSPLEYSSTTWYSSCASFVVSDCMRWRFGLSSSLSTGPTGTPTITCKSLFISNIFSAINAAFPPMYFCLKPLLDFLLFFQSFFIIVCSRIFPLEVVEICTQRF